MALDKHFTKLAFFDFLLGMETREFGVQAGAEDKAQIIIPQKPNLYTKRKDVLGVKDKLMRLVKNPLYWDSLSRFIHGQMKKTEYDKVMEAYLDTNEKRALHNEFIRTILYNAHFSVIPPPVYTYRYKAMSEALRSKMEFRKRQAQDNWEEEEITEPCDTENENSFIFIKGKKIDVKKLGEADKHLKDELNRIRNKKLMEKRKIFDDEEEDCTNAEYDFDECENEEDFILLTKKLHEKRAIKQKQIEEQNVRKKKKLEMIEKQNSRVEKIQSFYEKASKVHRVEEETVKKQRFEEETKYQQKLDELSQKFPDIFPPRSIAQKRKERENHIAQMQAQQIEEQRSLDDNVKFQEDQKKLQIETDLRGKAASELIIKNLRYQSFFCADLGHLLTGAQMQQKTELLLNNSDLKIDSSAIFILLKELKSFVLNILQKSLDLSRNENRKHITSYHVSHILLYLQDTRDLISPILFAKLPAP